MKLFRIIPVLTFSAFTLLVSAVFLMSGSEAHIINVTAKIEAPMCDARSIGYWANNEGCSHGTGSSNWASEVQTLSATYTGVFETHTGEQMCAAVWMPNCSPLVPGGARRCRAMAHTLAVELNVASGRLHRSAFLAGADDGDLAFYRLHLFESSTIHEALITLESILGNPQSSSVALRDAAHVAMRIYSFYEDENPFHPRCIFDLDDIPACRASARGNVTVTTVVETTANTGGNSANGGSGDNASDGGNVETGDTSTETVIEKEVNTNVTDISCDNCTPCGDACADAATAEEVPEQTSESEEPLVEEQTTESNMEEPQSSAEATSEADPNPPQETTPTEAQ